MKYVAVFHANLNYAYLVPEKYEFVIRKSYELIIDTMRDVFPDCKYTFEASGYTLEHIAKKTPDVLEKLKDAIDRGQCEFMGGPYAHPMLPNFPEEDGFWALQFANDIYQKYLGIQPKSLWNPECGWRHYVPRIVAKAGYKNMMGEFEAYSRSRDPQGKPLRPEIFDLEYSDKPAFYNMAFKYDLPGTEKAIHFPWNKVQDLGEDEFRVLMRTDRICVIGTQYMLSMPGADLDHYMSLIKKYSEQPEGEPEGALVVFAEDAEYVGTNGWFKLKYQNDPESLFEHTPESKQNLINLINECKKLGGRFVTFDEACQTTPPLEGRLYIDDDAAWHGAKASTWAATPMAKALRPWQDLVRAKLKQVEGQLDDATRRSAWFYLTNSYNSDGQWPPTLPDHPHIIHPFNYQYCFENLLQAELLVGGVDRSGLSPTPSDTIKAILTMQQDMVVASANRIIKENKDAQSMADAQKALTLIKQSKDLSTIETSNATVLFPAEYTARVNLLVEARQLVGGLEV